MRGTPGQMSTHGRTSPTLSATRAKTRARIRHHRPLPRRIEQRSWDLSWNGKRERSARTIIENRPELSLVILDNRAAHRQPHSHSVVLRAVEGFEQRSEEHTSELQSQSNLVC